MAAFRLLLILLLSSVVIYTLPVVIQHGPNLFPVFFGDMLALDWRGQFNLDFMGFLTLSATWLAWRNGFTPGALALGVAGFFGGIPVLTAYLLYLSFKTDGDIAAMLLGDRVAGVQR